MDLEASPLIKGLDPTAGILKFIMEVPLQPFEPNIWIFIAEYCDPLCLQTFDAARSRRSANCQGSGAGLDRESALLATIGECLERYSACIVDKQRIKRASYRDIEHEAIDAAKVIRFSSAQYEQENFPFVRFNPDQQMDWLEGVNLARRVPQYVPAGMVYMNYQTRDRAEHLDKGYSTGLAAGRDLPSATLSALREVIERDAFTAYWLLGATPPKLDLESLPEDERAMLAPLLAVAGLQYDFRMLQTDLGVPCALSQVRCGSTCGISTGASCHPLASLAVRKALVESFHTFNWLLDMRRWGRRIDEKKDIDAFADHVAYYLDPTRHSTLGPFLADATTVPATDLPGAEEQSCKETLQYVVTLLFEKGFETTVVDITPPDVAELGMSVVRVVVPGLQPLYAGHEMYHLDSRRLNQMADYLQMEVPRRLNLEPHAFP